MLTFGELKSPSSRIDKIAQCCTDSAEFASLCNNAITRLLTRGDWSNTSTPIRLCVYQGCIVWPRYVHKVRRLNLCHNHALPMHNMWYEFLPGNQQGQWKQWCGSQCGLTQVGKTSVFQDVMGESRTIRAYPRMQADVGKFIFVFGTDNNGQPLKHTNNDGSIAPGAVITLAIPFGSTNTFVRHIDYIVKEETMGIVDCYAYNAATDTLENLASYDPGETNPSYSKTKLAIGSHNCCGVLRSVIAIVKLQFFPMRYDTDLCIVDNIEAIKLEIMAIKAEEAGDYTNRKMLEQQSIHALNRQLEDDSPDEIFAATDNVLGPYTFSNHCF